MRVEVAVVGAGIIGALAAYDLAKRGLEVLLLDAKKEGAATLASAGMLAPYPEGLSGEMLEAGLYGLRAYPGLLEELAGLGKPVEAGFPGTHVVALSRSEKEAWAAHREARPLDALPYSVRGGVGAWAFPGGYVHPAALREALLQAFQARGGGLPGRGGGKGGSGAAFPLRGRGESPPHPPGRGGLGRPLWP